MASVFTRILRGELPGRVVWRDERVAALLTIAPNRPGHTLVVPLREVDHWLEIDPDLLRHLTDVAQKVGAAIQEAFRPVKVGMIIAGLEVPHVHLHLIPITQLHDLDFTRADHKAKPEDLDAAAEKLRAALREFGHPEVVSG